MRRLGIVGLRCGVGGALALTMAGCAGPTGADVNCLRQKLGGVDSVSMAVAAKVCGHVQNGRLAPLDLRGAPDLQVEAKNAQVRYTPEIGK